MPTIARILLAASLAVPLCVPAPANAGPDALPGAAAIETFLQEALEEIRAPAGVAVAVYTPDGVYAHGFGLADVEAGEPVTADTAFYIASSTKSFNALAMNVMHHRGEIDLDATLSECAPAAPFPAAVHPETVTLRDLLTHTSGIANNPIAFRSAYSGEHTPDLLWDLLARSAVNEDAPHGTFEYTNTGYNILTLLADRRFGEAWQDRLDRMIIGPAGMTRTTAYMSRAESEGWSIARPYAPAADGQGQQRLYLEKVDATMQSAGGMVMSANDALIWLELLINDGRVGGEQILPADAVRETRERLARVDQQFDSYLREHYGLGWYVSAYRGETMIHHFGGFGGFRAHVSYLPERETGVAVFVSNAVLGPMADIVANHAYDVLLGVSEDEAGRAEAIAALKERYRGYADAIAADRERRAGRTWTLSLPRPAYAGTYANPDFGTLEIALEGETLTASLGVMHAPLEPFTDPDTARVELVPLQGRAMAFEIEDGSVAAVEYDGDRYVRE